ncbi:MAG: hypothetical protein AAGJ40_09470 [Planctomycetota bacterium]
MADVTDREKREQEFLALLLVLWPNESPHYWLTTPPSINAFTQRIRRQGITDLVRDVTVRQSQDFLDEIEWDRPRVDVFSGLDIVTEVFEHELGRRLANHHADWVREYRTAEREGNELPDLADLYTKNDAKREAITSLSTVASRAEIFGKNRIKDLYDESIASIWQLDPFSNVCPICMGLAGTPERIWRKEFPGGPPAHPNCRCHISHSLIVPSR